MLIHKNIKPGKFILKNSKFFNIYKVIKYINKDSDKKIKVNWLSKKIIKDELFKYNKLKNWKAKKSNVKDIKKIILTN